MTPIDLIALVGGFVAWALVNLVASTRLAGSGLWWYRVSGLVEGAAAGVIGLRTDDAAWIALGVLWILAKTWWVPAILARRFESSERYGVRARGTPRIFLGSALVLGVLWWVAGPLGVPLAALVAAFWVMAGRRELWVQAVMLLEAEIALGFLVVWGHAAPAVGDVLDVLEVLATAALLTWLGRTAQARFTTMPTSDDFTALKG